MFGNRKHKMALTPGARERAMRAIPHHAPVLRREQKESKLYLTVQFQRVRWQRLLGADRMCERTFGLDVYGQSVYERCDGKHAVKTIIKQFASQHHISETEAERAVTTFMQTLLSKGIILMEVEKMKS